MNEAMLLFMIKLNAFELVQIKELYKEWLSLSFGDKELPGALTQTYLVAIWAGWVII